MDFNKANSILGFAKEKNDAQIYDLINQPPFDFQVVTFNLTYGVAVPPESAKPIGFAFQSLYVVKSTHPGLVLKFRPNNDASYQGALELTEKDQINFGSPIAKGFIHWDAQSLLANGVQQSVTVLFAVRADFKSGSLSSVKGGINTNQYSSALQGNLALTGAAAATNLTETAGLAQIGVFTAGQTPRQVLIQNYTGGILYVGPTSSVDDGTSLAGANRGFAIANGDSFVWNNKVSLYGYAVTTGSVYVCAEF